MKRFIVLLLASLCGIALSQFPEFAQQYRQRVGGAADALSKIVIQFDASAAQAGLNREDALRRYAETSDDFLQERGRDMRSTIKRYEFLTGHFAEITKAQPFERLLVFVKARDMELTQATLESFEPAVPATPEGLIFGGAGVIGGWALLSLLLSPFGRRRTRR